ncbi:IMP cyclohydrolase / Phosphoribosylaminoimidazolecarboxamide formyltransferase [hydrothermal vent metagenome]|uniref:IMP cyclohydrolase / Phosphoribosylaminoimidazolecarboxamide formyltransferase n=1 Tax=hydrothermal vent metagenome TaxID=652676 RepID=A0A3B1DDY6_9ZZZZ
MSEKPQRVLVSVSDKQGLAPFVQELVALGFEIISTGGTRKMLEEAGIAAIDISEYTDFPEIMNGRVKTLHPKVHGAILGRPDLPSDAEAIDAHGIVPFQLVVCNLYPFEETIAKGDVTVPEAIEQIDIGGPSMIRSAAKNHAYVGVVTSPTQYDDVIAELKSGSLSENYRKKLCAAAFEMTAKYDRAIANYMATITATEKDATTFPETFSLNFQREATLRYGENPHQAAAFYVDENAHAATLAKAEQLHGKELSFNNLLDLEAAIAIVREFEQPAAVVLKHNNPCGCAIGESLPEVFLQAYAGDPVSAFGSIVGFNRTVDVATAEKLCEPNRFIEAIIAPEFEPASIEMISTIPTWKKNVRLMRCAAINEPRPLEFDMKRVSGGMLLQERDEQKELQENWKVVTERQPTETEMSDLAFAWKVAKHVKSNAILFAKEGAVVGVGAGQMSRLDSAFIAAHKAGERSRGAVVASDAFFPFRDGVDEAAKAGITAVIQPGGSRRDEEVIAACNEHHMTMIFTGQRHFKH